MARKRLITFSDFIISVIVFRNRYSGAFELKDELIPGSPQEQIEMKYRDNTALNYNVVDEDGNIEKRSSFNNTNFEPVVLFAANKTPDNDTFTSGHNPISISAAANRSRHSSMDSINRSSGRFQCNHPPPLPPAADRYYSEQSLIEKYLESQQEEYDTDNYTNRYADVQPANVDEISLQDEPTRSHNSLEKKHRDIDSRGSADGKPMDLPDYNELYGNTLERPPPKYGEQEPGGYSDAPRALFRGSEGGHTKRKRNRKSLDSLLLKTLEDIEEQAILANAGNVNTPALERNVAIVRDSLRDATRSYDSISSTCSSSVGELRRAFEFGRKYGLQQPSDLPQYLQDSMDDLTVEDLSDDDSEFLESAKLLNMLDLTNFSEQPKSVNDIKVKIPLPVRLQDTDDEEEQESSDDLEESEYGKYGMPALSLV